MKRFLRYLLLVGCIFIMAVWIWNLYRQTLVFYHFKDMSAWFLSLGDGALIFGDYFDFNSNFGFFVQHSNYSQNDSLTVRLGFYLPHYASDPSDGKAGGSYHYICLPFWIPFILFLSLTVIFWRKPFLAWWRGTHRKGFEVEIQKNERQDAEVAKEEKEKD